MKLTKIFLILLALFIFVFLIFRIALSQVKTGETISFSGVIENIKENFEFIVVNEMRISISSETKIVDENGNPLKIDELKLGLNVTIKAVRNPNDFFAKRVILNKKK
jgi:cell division protein FtsI/penicillin-binding protein 2